MISITKDFSSIENMHKAYLKCRKGKRKAANTRHFEVNLFNELLSLSTALQNGSYQPSRSVCFYVKKPKLREIFANMYLNELDQFVKRNLGVKYYIRYVDDFILMHNNKEQLNEWKQKIISYLENHLKLALKDENVQAVSVYKGIDFLGYLLIPYESVLQIKDKYIRIPECVNHFYRFKHQIGYFQKKYAE